MRPSRPLLAAAVVLLGLSLAACDRTTTESTLDPDQRPTPTPVETTVEALGCPEGYADAVTADLRRTAGVDEGFDAVEGDVDDLGVPELDEIGIECVVGAEIGPAGTRWHGFAFDGPGVLEEIDEALVAAGFMSEGTFLYRDDDGDRTMMVSRLPAADYFADLQDDFDVPVELQSASLIILTTS